MLLLLLLACPKHQVEDKSREDIELPSDDDIDELPESRH